MRPESSLTRSSAGTLIAVILGLVAGPVHGAVLGGLFELILYFIVT
jgi:hypothetical protein